MANYRFRAKLSEIILNDELSLPDEALVEVKLEDDLSINRSRF